MERSSAVSMVWSHNPISLRSAGTWYDVANLHGRCIDHDPIYEQFDDRALGREWCVLQAVGHARTEGL
jgi:hypothetical protein